MDTRKLEHFLAVYEHGSFSKASKAVHLTQSALSRSIQSIEHDLGVMLFDRCGVNPKMTAAGFQLLIHARRILSQTHDLEYEIAQFRHGHMGHIALAVSPTPASVFLKPCLLNIAKRRPGLVVNAYMGRTQELIEGLRTDRFDLAIVDATAIGDENGLLIEHLPPLFGGFLVRSGHPLLSMTSFSVEALKAYPVTCSPISHDLEKRIAAALGPGGHPKQLISFFCDSYHVQRDMLLQSDTVVLSAFAAMEADIRAGTVTILPSLPMMMGYYAIVRLVDRTICAALHYIYDEAVPIFEAAAKFDRETVLSCTQDYSKPMAAEA